MTQTDRQRLAAHRQYIIFFSLRYPSWCAADRPSQPRRAVSASSGWLRVSYSLPGVLGNDAPPVAVTCKHMGAAYVSVGVCLKNMPSYVRTCVHACVQISRSLLRMCHFMVDDCSHSMAALHRPHLAKSLGQGTPTSRMWLAGGGPAALYKERTPRYTDNP